MAEKIRALAIHGGAGAKPDTAADRKNLNEQMFALQQLITTYWKHLKSGMTALDVVTYCVAAMEDDPSFNAGKGASLGDNKQIELDAGFMLDSGQFGAVTGITVVQNPIHVARHVMEEEYEDFFQGEGANAIAKHVAKLKNLQILRSTKSLRTPYRKLRYEEWFQAQNKVEIGDTVGVIAFDGSTIAVGSSTGGPAGKKPGRVGDVPVRGKGVYADETGAAAATGAGKYIIIHGTAEQAVQMLRGTAFETERAQKAAMAASLGLNNVREGSGGVIVVDRFGNVGAAHNTPFMPHALMRTGFKKPIVLDKSVKL